MCGLCVLTCALAYAIGRWKGEKESEGGRRGEKEREKGEEREIRKRDRI